MLLDLIETRGDKGKWFAAAKDPGFSTSLLCAFYSHLERRGVSDLRLGREGSRKAAKFRRLKVSETLPLAPMPRNCGPFC
jgi:hypothetical protein